MGDGCGDLGAMIKLVVVQMSFGIDCNEFCSSESMYGDNTKVVDSNVLRAV